MPATPMRPDRMAAFWYGVYLCEMNYAWETSPSVRYRRKRGHLDAYLVIEQLGYTIKEAKALHDSLNSASMRSS